MAAWPALCLLTLLGCDGGSTATPPYEGRLLVDSLVELVEFEFSRAACDEVLPDSFARSDSLPAGTATRLVVVSTACYAVALRIEDSLGAPVRTLERYFDIPGRQDGDKVRGAVGYLPWDGLDADGKRVPPGAYLWRLEFRFGAGRSVRYRADMRLE